MGKRSFIHSIKTRGENSYYYQAMINELIEVLPNYGVEYLTGEVTRWLGSPWKFKPVATQIRDMDIQNSRPFMERVRAKFPGYKKWKSKKLLFTVNTP